MLFIWASCRQSHKQRHISIPQPYLIYVWSCRSSLCAKMLQNVLPVLEFKIKQTCIKLPGARRCQSYAWVTNKISITLLRFFWNLFQTPQHLNICQELWTRFISCERVLRHKNNNDMWFCDVVRKWLKSGNEMLRKRNEKDTKYFIETQKLVHSIVPVCMDGTPTYQDTKSPRSVIPVVKLWQGSSCLSNINHPSSSS